MESPSRSRRTDRDGAPLRSVLVAIGLTILGVFVLPNFTTIPSFLIDPAMLESPSEASITARTAFMVLNFVGIALGGVVYLVVSDRDWSYVDLRWPTTRGWKYVLGGIVGSIAFYFLVSILIQLLSIPTAESEVVHYIGGDQTMLLIMIGIVFFFNAPAEEFLFRNIVQKRLYDAFTRMQSVLIASVIFALIHFPMYVLYADTVLATLSSLTVIFGGSIIFGTLYAKTDNLVVPIAAHAALNAIQFALLYVAMEYDLEGAPPETADPALLVDALAVLPL